MKGAIGVKDNDRFAFLTQQRILNHPLLNYGFTSLNMYKNRNLPAANYPYIKPPGPLPPRYVFLGMTDLV